MGANSARWSQPARPRAHRHPADPVTQRELPLPAGVGEHHPAQELQLGGPPGRGSALLTARTRGSVPRAGVPHTTPLSLHPSRDHVQRPTPQGGAPLPG